MLIKALCDYAEKQQASSSQNASVPEYYRPQKISYRIVLSPEGKLLDILPQQHLETYYDKRVRKSRRMFRIRSICRSGRRNQGSSPII